MRGEIAPFLVGTKQVYIIGQSIIRAYLCLDDLLVDNSLKV